MELPINHDIDSLVDELSERKVEELVERLTSIKSEVNESDATVAWSLTLS